MTPEFGGLAGAGTSAGTPMLSRTAAALVICASGALHVPGTAADTQEREVAPVLMAQTSAGLLYATELSGSSAVAELRRISGLTWEQLARVFDVSRRSVHFWASGQPMNAANEERLQRTLRAVRAVDRGSAVANRTAILTALTDGTIPYDVLKDQQFDEFVQALGATGTERGAELRPLSAEAVAARRPPRPAELVGARHDLAHEQAGPPRRPRVAKAKRKT